MRRLLPLLAAALLLAACGAEDAAPPPARDAAPPAPATEAAPPAPAAASSRPARRGVRLTVVRSPFGRVVADGRGQAFYLFDKEESRRSECFGDCARAWPPVLAGGRPVAGKGIDPQLIGTTRRRSGRRQLTYAGRPMYYYVADAPGRILCHDVPEFGGTWLVLRPDGSPAPS